jgi:hypothetical protein
MRAGRRKTAASHETGFCNQSERLRDRAWIVGLSASWNAAPEGASRARGSVECRRPIPVLGIVAGCGYRTWRTRRARQLHEPHRPREPCHSRPNRGGEAPAARAKHGLSSLALLHDNPCQLRASRKFLRDRAHVNRARLRAPGAFVRSRIFRCKCFSKFTRHTCSSSSCRNGAGRVGAALIGLVCLNYMQRGAKACCAQQKI